MGATLKELAKSDNVGRADDLTAGGGKAVMTARRAACGVGRATLVAAGIGAASMGARAQPPGAVPQNTEVHLNYVYAASLGFGGYSLAGLTASVYTLPLAYALPDVLHEGWTLRLLLPIQLGIYSFQSTFEGIRISLSQQSIAAVPGAELQIPLTDNFVAKPFAQFGAAHTFGTDGGNADAYIYLAGARSVAQWQAGEYTLSLGNGVVFAGDSTIGPGFGENYVSLQVAGEIRRPVGFSIGDFKPDLGVYLANYFYPAPLVFSRFLQSPLRIHNQDEIGFSIGSAEPFKLLWLSNPRIGAGFVFGGGLKVWHVNFGFPF